MKDFSVIICSKGNRKLFGDSLCKCEIGFRRVGVIFIFRNEFEFIGYFIYCFLSICFLVVVF